MKNSGYILSVVAATISSYIVIPDHSGAFVVLGGLITIILVSAIPPGIIYIF